jgi:high-affinity iron transporter
VLKRGCKYPVAIIMILSLIFVPGHVRAAGSGIENMAGAEFYVDQALQYAAQGQWSKVRAAYQQFRNTWLKIEDSIKTESIQAYSDIEMNMGQVEYALLQDNPSGVVQALRALQSVNERFIHGQYAASRPSVAENMTLRDFIILLQKTKEDAERNDVSAAQADLANAQRSWLLVEGTVVAQSSVVYNDTERDMVTVHAMLAAQPPDTAGAVRLLQRMTDELGPLSGKTGYTLWDAAMIPIREGLEALLVIGALLAFVRKSNQGEGKHWIWAGVAAGLVVSATLAVLVKFVFSSGAFGNNNFLISGWTGVIAAGMLLYVSYWLHSQSSISGWQHFIQSRSQLALSTGKLASLGLLSFLAVFREGTETVLFVVGMVNQISMQQLLTGLLLGIGVLVVVAYLMLFLGLKLPMRPFFVVSSVIVFYLCVKFTGMGIHSLQLAGVLPSTIADNWPSVDFLALYPSWQSLVPQLLLVVLAVSVVLWKNILPGKQDRHSVQ